MYPNGYAGPEEVPRARPPRQSSRAGAGSARQRESSYGTRMLVATGNGSLQPRQNNLNPSLRSNSPNLPISSARSTSPAPVDLSSLPYLNHAGPTTNALLRGRAGQLPPPPPPPPLVGQPERYLNGNSHLQSRQRPTPPKPPHQPLPPLPALPQLPPQPVPSRGSPVSLKDTPPIKRSATASTTTSNGSGNSKFASPPPPPPPPPRDIPLPPLPAVPTLSKSGSAASASLSAAGSSGSLRNDNARDLARLGHGRAPIARDLSEQFRLASAPANRSEAIKAGEQRIRSNSGELSIDSRSHGGHIELGRPIDSGQRPNMADAGGRKSSLEAVRLMNTNTQRTKTPEPIAKVLLASEDDGDRASDRSIAAKTERTRGSMDIDRQAESSWSTQAESSRQAQLRGLGLAALGGDPADRAASLPSQSNTKQAYRPSPPRASREQERPALPGQSPQLNGSWPASSTGKKWGISPLISMIDDSNAKRREYSSLNGRKSEDVGATMGRASEQGTRPPAVQPRKSSGGLRGLFSRNKKDKDKGSSQIKQSTIPELDAPRDFAPQMVPRRRASEDLLRTRKKQDEMAPVERSTRTPEPGAFTRRVTEPLQMYEPPETTKPRDTSPKSIKSSGLYRQRSIHSPGSMHSESDGKSTDTVSTVKGHTPVPPLLSLPLPNLPTLDFNLGSTFDNLFKDFNGTTSPVAPPTFTSNPVHFRRRSRSFSGYTKPAVSPPLASSISKLPSAESNASLIADLRDYSQFALMEDGSTSESTVPALSKSEHGRTMSTTSSQMIDTSPPRTPGSNETAQVRIAGSSSSCSLEGMPTSESVDSADMAIVGKAWTNSVSEKAQKSARPRLLQLAESKLSTSTIIEQDEGGSEAGKQASSAPSTSKLEPSIEILPAVVEHRPVEMKATSKVRRIPLRYHANPVKSTASKMASSEAMRRILNMFQLGASMKNIDKAGLIRTELLDTLVEGEKHGYNEQDRTGNSAMRSICVEWVNVLLNELKYDQAANERGACLEALSGIMESSTLSIKALRGQPNEEATFRHLMVQIMTYVLDKLSGKGVFHNTLLFAGRMLAFAFFRIEGIAFRLLAALPTKPATLMRFARATKEFSFDRCKQPEIQYPAHLIPLQYDTSPAYSARIAAYTLNYSDSEEDEAFQFGGGNWLRRWQSDDSELFPAFYKAYHRNLATYLSDAVEAAASEGVVIPAGVLIKAPGYLHLASVYSNKMQSYIMGAVNAVTTTSASNSFNADESLGTRGNAKPPVLETANRRLTEIILNLSNSRVWIQSKSGTVLECDGSELWSSMVDIWVKYLISRTSLYSPRSVFCLLDLLDGVVAPSLDHLASRNLADPPVFKATLMDIPHLISVLRIVLTETDHHLTLAKCVAFIWTHYDTICARVEDREALCMKLLLDPQVFERLVLFWSQSVRSYILRLIVFRLGHVYTEVSDVTNHEMEVAIVQMLHSRLERIRRRHDELEPKDPMVTPPAAPHMQLAPDDMSDGPLPRSRSTITMVEAVEKPEESSSITRAERLLGLEGTESANQETEAVAADPNGKSKGKAASWFKKPFGKQKKRKTGGEGEPEEPLTKPIKGNQPAIVTKSILLQAGMDTQDSPISPAALSHKSAGGESIDSFEGDASALQPRGGVVPNITTTNTPSLRFNTPEPPASPRSPSKVQFEFELPTASPRSDAFDKRPISSLHSPAVASNPQRMPASPSMSRSFSKRSSLLQPVATGIVDGPASPSFRRSMASVPEVPGYDKKLHPYCIRMLAELEDVQREYDEWWAEDGPGRQDSAPPRLTIAWPFAEEED